MEGTIKGKVLQKLLFSKSKMFVGFLSVSSDISIKDFDFLDKKATTKQPTFLLLSLLFKGKDKNDRLPHSLKEQLGVGDIVEISGILSSFFAWILSTILWWLFLYLVLCFYSYYAGTFEFGYTKSEEDEIESTKGKDIDGSTIENSEGYHQLKFFI